MRTAENPSSDISPPLFCEMSHPFLFAVYEAFFAMVALENDVQTVSSAASTRLSNAR